MNGDFPELYKPLPEGRSPWFLWVPMAFPMVSSQAADSIRCISTPNLPQEFFGGTCWKLLTPTKNLKRFLHSYLTYLSIYLSIYLSNLTFIYLSICPSIYLSIYLSICPSIYLPIQVDIVYSQIKVWITTVWESFMGRSVNSVFTRLTSRREDSNDRALWRCVPLTNQAGLSLGQRTALSMVYERTQQHRHQNMHEYRIHGTYYPLLVTKRANYWK